MTQIVATKISEEKIAKDKLSTATKSFDIFLATHKNEIRCKYDRLESDPEQWELRIGEGIKKITLYLRFHRPKISKEAKEVGEVGIAVSFQQIDKNNKGISLRALLNPAEISPANHLLLKAIRLPEFKPLFIEASKIAKMKNFETAILPRIHPVRTKFLNFLEQVKKYDVETQTVTTLDPLAEKSEDKYVLNKTQEGSDRILYLLSNFKNKKFNTEIGLMIKDSLKLPEARRDIFVEEFIDNFKFLDARDKSYKVGKKDFDWSDSKLDINAAEKWLAVTTDQALHQEYTLYENRILHGLLEKPEKNSPEIQNKIKILCDNMKKFQVPINPNKYAFLDYQRLDILEIFKKVNTSSIKNYLEKE